MNLQEALSYRNNCIICDHPMETKSLDLAGLTFTTDETGLHIKGGTKDYHVSFNYDGTYQRSKKWWSTYVKPLSVLKECPRCLPDDFKDGIKAGTKAITKADLPSRVVILKGRSVGMSSLVAQSTLNSLKDLRCAYAFNIFGDAENNYTCEMKWEDIKFHNNIEFNHFITDFDKNESSIKGGNFQSDSIDSMIRINVPAINTSKLLTREALINKIKLYNLFS